MFSARCRCLLPASVIFFTLGLDTLLKGQQSGALLQRVGTARNPFARATLEGGGRRVFYRPTPRSEHAIFGRSLPHNPSAAKVGSASGSRRTALLRVFHSRRCLPPDPAAVGAAITPQCPVLCAPMRGRISSAQPLCHRARSNSFPLAPSRTLAPHACGPSRGPGVCAFVLWMTPFYPWLWRLGSSMACGCCSGCDAALQPPCVAAIRRETLRRHLRCCAARDRPWCRHSATDPDAVEMLAGPE